MELKSKDCHELFIGIGQLLFLSKLKKKKLHLLFEFVQTTLQYSGLMQEGYAR